MKKEKTENFNRRQMGEKGPNKQERELIRRKKQAERDEFDMNNLGNYKLVYPVQGNPVSIVMLNNVNRTRQRSLITTSSRRKCSGVS